MGTAGVPHVKSSANIALFFPEEKWSSLTGQQQFLRSVVTHGAVILVLFGVLPLANSSHRPTQSPSIYLDLSLTAPVSSAHTSVTAEGSESPGREHDTVARTPLESTINKTVPSGEVKPPEISAPTTRKGPVVKEVLQAGEEVVVFKQPDTVAIPVSKMATSPVASITPAGPTKDPASKATVEGQGAATRGARQAQPVTISGVQTAQPSLPKDGILSSRDTLNARSGAGQVAIAPVEKLTFAELDSRACAAFYQGEQKASAAPDEAKKLYEEAAELMVRGIPVLEQEQGPECNEMALALSNTGRCFNQLEQYSTAASYFERAAKLYDKLGKKDSAELGASLVYLADALTKQGKYAEAEKPLRDSLPIYCNHYGKESQYVAWTYQRLSTVCSHIGRTDEAANYTKLANGMLGQR